MPPRSAETLGRLQVITSGIAFGFLGWFGKTAYARGITPGELLSLRFSTSAVLIGLWLLITERHALKVPRAQFLKCVALGMFGYAVFSSCYFNALKGLSASLTVLLLYLYPVLVTLGGWIFFKDPMSPKAWSALALALTGVVALVWGEWSVSSPIALLFGLGSAVFYSLYILSARRFIRGTHALSSSFFIQCAAAVTLFTVHFGRDGGPTQAYAIWTGSPLLFIGIALVCTWLAMTLFLMGVQKLKSAEVAILSMTEPVAAVVIATLVLDERMSVVQIAGAGLVLAAMALNARAQNKPA